MLPITYPNVKKLEILSGKREAMMQLIQVNRQLESLAVPFCYALDLDCSTMLQEINFKNVEYN
jgi:hypothetical protein